MTDNCANCSHLITYHQPDGCGWRITDVSRCVCRWYEDGAEMVRCPAEYRQGGILDRCEIQVRKDSRHAGIHSSGGYQWVESDAVYPTPGCQCGPGGHTLLGECLPVANPDRVSLPGRKITAEELNQMEVPASETQVGGDHYRKHKIQPWDVIDEYELGFYRGSALKYLLRAGSKGPAVEDFRKAKHCIEKCIEREEEGK